MSKTREVVKVVAGVKRVRILTINPIRDIHGKGGTLPIGGNSILGQRYGGALFKNVTLLEEELYLVYFCFPFNDNVQSSCLLF